MKRLLLPLLAAFALPTAVNANTYSLMVLEVRTKTTPGLFEAIPNITFSTYEACIEEGERFANRNDRWWSYHCFRGQ